MKENYTPGKQRDYLQEANHWIDETEKLGYQCEALRELIEKLDSLGFDPEEHRLDEDEPLQKPPLPPSRY